MKEFLKWLETYEDISDDDAEYITLHLSTFGLKDQILYNLLRKYNAIFYEFFDEKDIIITLIYDEKVKQFGCSVEYLDKTFKKWDWRETNQYNKRITAEINGFILAFNILENND